MRPLIAEMKASYSDLSGNKGLSSIIGLNAVSAVPKLAMAITHAPPASKWEVCAMWCGYRVRNVWSCDACGYQFEDTVFLSAREAADSS
jgi:hypothetical protein